MQMQYTFGEESDLLWVDTIYCTFKGDLSKMSKGHSLRSKYMKFSYLRNRFRFSVAKISEGTYGFGVLKEAVDAEPDYGYELQLSFSVVPSVSSEKTISMASYHVFVQLRFTLDEFYPLGNKRDELMLKCVVRMLETSRLRNDRSAMQEYMWQKKLAEVVPDYAQHQEIASAMGLRGPNNLFSGRQDNSFADYKSTLLQRSFLHAEQLMSKTENHRHNEDTEYVSSGLILGYIKNGEFSCISEKDCILLYASAFYCGLDYLKPACADFLRASLTCVDFLIDVLIVADLVDDKYLAEHALSWFWKNKTKVLSSVQWNNFKNRNYRLACGFATLAMQKELNSIAERN